jgi:diaminopimelate decarboxylase
MQRIAAFLPELEKIGAKIEMLDIGGGFGIWYKDKLAKPAKEIAASILPMLQRMNCRVLLEPGRFIVGNAGVLVTRVLYVKESGDKKFVICDAGMNDLIRPTLYSAYHRIWPVKTDPGHSGEAPDEETWSGARPVTDIVGPICRAATSSQGPEAAAAQRGPGASSRRGRTVRDGVELQLAPEALRGDGGREDGGRGDGAGIDGRPAPEREDRDFSLT